MSNSDLKEESNPNPMSSAVPNEEIGTRQQVVQLSDWEEMAVKFRPNLIRVIATRSKIFVGACVALSYVSVVGSIVTSHCGSLSFATFRSLLPFAVAILSAIFYAVVLNNASASPNTHRKFISLARFLIEMSLAALAWSAGEFMGPIIGTHIATLFRDAAVVFTVMTYAEMPRSFNDNARMDSTDTIEIRLAMWSYVGLSVILSAVLPFVIPGRWIAVFTGVVHFSTAGSAFFTSIRFRHDMSSALFTRSEHCLTVWRW